MRASFRQIHLMVRSRTLVAWAWPASAARVYTAALASLLSRKCWGRRPLSRVAVAPSLRFWRAPLSTVREATSDRRVVSFMLHHRCQLLYGTRRLAAACVGVGHKDRNNKQKAFFSSIGNSQFQIGVVKVGNFSQALPIVDRQYMGTPSNQSILV